MSLLRALTLCLTLPTLAAAEGLIELTDFGPNPGALKMWTPPTAPVDAQRPLIVALHGCTQNASLFDSETGLTRLAQDLDLLLLFPEQQAANMQNRCFHFYHEEDTAPGQGEGASIIAAIDHLVTTQNADPERVFILGLSGGGAMSAAMLAGYPDRFAGGAIIAGVPYGCNRPAGWLDYWYWAGLSLWDGLDASYACGIYGYERTDRAAEDWASYVTALGPAPQDWPLLSIWQGTADEAVDPRNLTELTEQWTEVMGLDRSDPYYEHHAIDGGTATRRLYPDASGSYRLETWELPGFPHAVPIWPEEGCGTAGADHMEDADICAVWRIASFWGL